MCKHILINDFQASDMATICHFASLTSDKDGYGAIMRTKTNAIETLKSLDLATFYVNLTERLMKGDIGTVVVHHRTSTNGDGINYAHPFEYDGVYMTHNGVVTVPGLHTVKTTNDSEALLHHLVKTGFDTLSIQGYFSCFLLSSLQTFVLVDDMAPMYTNGRVYSSHNLGEGYGKVSLSLLALDNMTGTILQSETIQVTKSSYGWDKAGLSLGKTWSSYADDSAWEGYVEKSEPSETVIDFFDLLAEHERLEYNTHRSDSAALSYIEDLAYSMGLTPTREELCEIMEYLDKEKDDTLYA